MPNLVNSEQTLKAILHFACIEVLLEDIEEGKMKNQLREVRGRLVAFFKRARSSGQRNSYWEWSDWESGWSFSSLEPLGRTTDSIPSPEYVMDSIQNMLKSGADSAFELISPGFKQSGRVILPRMAGGERKVPDWLLP